ncbi:putative hydrolase of the HAD superfamily [Evansella caseinilytica]|uniref:Putative hydrolase of the HAD superfamily n=1 Tax=Evansella caseinilytica TaxID=1503961 RepID=A0A1H3NZN9_9BACI|nr:HAD family hydrolase [Evansella caseinilytica]SDY94163.1 putative hydrolase of the HAD superfamily [Evansella caseinilytica]
MKKLFQESKVIIFDLDGTLYEDTDHFSYYADELMRELDESKHHEFAEEYRKIINGDHIVSIGKVYDVVKDYVLSVNSAAKVQQVWTWDGKPVDPSEWQTIYPHPLTFDFDAIIAIGDGWWLPNVCAKHFGAVDTYSAYNRTKEFMVTPQFQLTKIPRLREALLHLKTKKEVVLLTNSQADDVQRLLHTLDLRGMFHRVVTEAKKPQHTLNHFSQLLKAYNIEAAEALSIGDNYLNEIAPALHIGMKTIFIDFYSRPYPEYQGVKVQSIAETIDAMLRV